MFVKLKRGLTTNLLLAFTILTDKHINGMPEDVRFSPGKAYDQYMPNIREKILKSDELKKISDELGCSMAQMAVAWCVSNQNVSTVMLGAFSLAQLEDNLEATRFVDKITPDIKARIDTAVDYHVQVPEKDVLGSIRLKRDIAAQICSSCQSTGLLLVSRKLEE